MVNTSKQKQILLSSNPFVKNARVFWLLWVVQTKYWADNIMNLFVGIGVSTYTMLCWLVFKSGDPFLLVSGISLGIIRNGLSIYQKTLIDWREQGTLKKLDNLPLNKYVKTSAIISFNFVSTISIALFMFLLAIISFPEQRYLLPYANWWMVMSGFLLTWLISFFVGTAVYLYVKKAALSQAIGILIYTTSLYFLGLSFPIETIMDPRWAWFGDILYIWPHRYSLNIVQAGFANISYAFKEVENGLFVVDRTHFTGIMNIINYPLFDNDGKAMMIEIDGKWIQKTVTVDFGFGGKAWIAYLGCFACTILYATLTLYRTIKNSIFHQRSEYGKVVINQTNSRYLSALKRAKTIAEIELLHEQRIDHRQNKLDGGNKNFAPIQSNVQTPLKDEQDDDDWDEN